MRGESPFLNKIRVIKKADGSEVSGGFISCDTVISNNKVFTFNVDGYNVRANDRVIFSCKSCDCNTSKVKREINPSSKDDNLYCRTCRTKLTCTERYGVDSVMDVEAFRDKISVSKLAWYKTDVGIKRKKEFILESKERWKDINYIEKLISSSSNRHSKFSIEVGNFLSMFGKWESEVRLDGTRYSIDFVNKDKMIAIECQGDYWHCNPKKYRSDYFNSRSGLYAREIWTKDMNRMNKIKSAGYRSLFLYESEWKNLYKKYCSTSEYLYLMLISCANNNVLTDSDISNILSIRKSYHK